jgi:hypothetical protein
MLNDYGLRNANRKEKISELLNDDDLADENISNNNSQQDFIKQYKKEILEIREKLEKEKQ